MNLEELQKLKDKAQRQVALREGNKKYRVVISMGTSGIAAGARDVMKTMLDEIDKQNIGNADICITAEMGMVESEPMVRVEEAGGEKTVYGKVNSEGARQIVNEHLQHGQKVQKLAIGRPKNED